MRFGTLGSLLVGALALGALAAEARAEDKWVVTVEGTAQGTTMFGGFDVAHFLGVESFTFTLTYVVDLDVESSGTTVHGAVSYPAYPMTFVLRDGSTGDALYSVTSDTSQIDILDDHETTGADAFAISGAVTSGNTYTRYVEEWGIEYGFYAWRIAMNIQATTAADPLDSTALIAAPTLADFDDMHWGWLWITTLEDGEPDGGGGLLEFYPQTITVERFVTEVDIDILPNVATNPIRLGSQANVPVAILSSASFDAADVDPATITLANATVALRGRKGTLAATMRDVNGDGLDDLVVQIDTTSLALNSGDIEAVLTATTYDGRPIRGVDGVTIVNN